MFERRLKVVLIILAAMICVLVGRAAQVQIVNKEYWQQEAASAMRRSHLVDSTRGAIRDRNNKILALDEPCIDACIDYPALTHPPDPAWLKDKATDTIRHRLGDDVYKKTSKKQLAEMRDQEIAKLQANIDAMWDKLAKLSSKSPDEIQDIRESVIRRVQMRQQYVYHARIVEALKKEGKTEEDEGAIKKFLSAGDGDSNQDSLNVVVAEQREPQVILRAIDTATQNELGKNIDQYPGLVLKPGSHREYPYNDVACHLLGVLGRVNADEVKNQKKDDLHSYLPNDLIGRAGVEALCEPSLKGVRGRVDRALGETTLLERVEPIPGKDVRLSIDVELQQQIQTAFEHATLRDAYGRVDEEDAVLHGAAVVLDVKTNNVLALVSYPTYDLNHYEELYSKLYADDVDAPLRNRATMSTLQPGSTVKPFCGMAGIMAGVVKVNEGIECTGYLVLDGKKLSQGRCWVASMYANDPRVPSVSHHPIPFPHQGHDGNADGFLTYSDGLERSCNVYFETVADRLKIDRLSEWYSKFGLGRVTGIGLAEATGILPNSFHGLIALRRSTGFFAGIGQGRISATPIQMANAAAMLARGGIWMRPNLLLPGVDGNPPDVKENAWHGTPERVDLHLDPAAVAAAKDGMWRVVNGQSGTGKALVAGDKELQSLQICGKTGTAQAPMPMRVVKGPDGKPAWQAYEPNEPWFRKDKDGKLDHAWYIGFAPRDNPTIAFAVMVEYGGSGGVSAASVAREALQDCMLRGYVKPAAPPIPATQVTVTPTEPVQ